MASSEPPRFDGCNVNQDCADSDGRPVQQGQQANFPEADFAVTVRRFAPYYNFGGGFEGDAKSRHIPKASQGHGGFTTDPNATSRTSMTVQVDSLFIDSEAHADPSRHPWLGEGLADVRVNSVSTAASSLDGVINAHSEGANPLLFGAPDIDTDLNLTYELKPGALELQGTVWGDRFPDAELFVSDPEGARLRLGDFQTKGSVWDLIGPAPRIPEKDLLHVHAEIALDPTGNFAGSPVVKSE